MASKELIHVLYLYIRLGDHFLSQEKAYKTSLKCFHIINPDPPGVNENLPDIYRLMASLEEGENQLDNAREPPSLYTRPEQVIMLIL